MTATDKTRSDVFFLVSSLNPGGTELRLLEICRRLPDDIAAHVCGMGVESPLVDHFKAAGSDVMLAPIRRPWREWSAVLRIVHRIRRLRPITVNTFDLKGLLISSAARLACGRQVRLVHHLVDLHFKMGRRQSAVLWRLLEGVDAVVCDAGSIREELIGERRLRPPVTVIPNGVDAQHFAPDVERRYAQRTELGYRDSDIVIGMVANFRPEKNHRLLVEGFRELRRLNPNVRLLCVGGGPLREEIASLVSRHGLSSDVVLTGHVTDVRPFLAAMDVFVLCSLKDAFANAVLQAMSTGLATVCSRTGEYRSIMADGEVGLLFDPEDQEEFVTTLRRVVEDRACRDRLGVAARRLVEERFQISDMVTGYVELYRQLARCDPV